MGCLMTLLVFMMYVFSSRFGIGGVLFFLFNDNGLEAFLEVVVLCKAGRSKASLAGLDFVLLAPG